MGVCGEGAGGKVVKPVVPEKDSRALSDRPAKIIPMETHCANDNDFFNTSLLNNAVNTTTLE